MEGKRVARGVSAGSQGKHGGKESACGWWGVGVPPPLLLRPKAACASLPALAFRSETHAHASMSASHGRESHATHVDRSNELALRRHYDGTLTPKEVRAMRYYLEEEEYAAYRRALADREDDAVLELHHSATHRMKGNVTTPFLNTAVPANKQRSSYSIVRPYEVPPLLYNIFDPDGDQSAAVLVEAKVSGRGAIHPALPRFLSPHYPAASSIRIVASFSAPPRADGASQGGEGAHTARGERLVQWDMFKDALRRAEEARRRVIHLANEYSSHLNKMLSALKCETTAKRRRDGEYVSEAAVVKLDSVHFESCPRGMGAMRDGSSFDSARIRARRGDEDDGAYGAHAMHVLGTLLLLDPHTVGRSVSRILPHGVAPRFSSGAETVVVEGRVRYLNESGEPTCDNSVTLKMGDHDDMHDTSVKASYLEMHQGVHDINLAMLDIQKSVVTFLHLHLEIVDATGNVTQRVPVRDWHEDVTFAIGVGCYLPQISRLATDDDGAGPSSRARNEERSDNDAEDDDEEEDSEDSEDSGDDAYVEESDDDDDDEEEDEDESDEEQESDDDEGEEESDDDEGEEESDDEGEEESDDEDDGSDAE